MRLALFIILSVVFASATAQDTISRELKFVRHLIDREEYSDAIYYITTRLNAEYPMPVRDSLNFYKGWGYYSIKKLNLSANALSEVSSNSPFFFKSRFFAAYNYSHLGIIPVSERLITDLKMPINFEPLRNFELAGNSLLKRDLKGFDTLFRKIETNSQFSFDLEKNKLKDFASEISLHKNKSMFIGGLMSALLPGAGKVYAGKTGEGISTFIIVGAAGLTAWENYHKLGIDHAKTILFGSLFAVLYIGNIYGAVFTVKLVNEEFNHEMDNKILFNMHIPLRIFFN